MGDVAELRPTKGLVPPTDLDAEAVVLSAIFDDPTRLYDVQAVTSERDFYSVSNRYVLRAIESLDRAGGGVDVVTVATWLRDHGLLDQVGGTPYLMQLTNATPATANVRDHAFTVANKGLQRRVIATCQTIASEGYGAVEDPRAWAREAERQIYETVRSHAGEEHDNTLRGIVREAFDSIGKRSRGEGDPAGIPTGWPALDRRIGGWRPKIYVVGGRPGMGKSAFVTQACVNVAESGRAAVLVSLEQEHDEIATRVVSQDSRIDYVDLESGNLTPNQWDDATASVARIERFPMSVCVEKGGTVGEIRSAVRHELSILRRVHGEALELGMVAVDYAQLINGERQRGESRDAELTRVSTQLQWLSGEFKCAVVVVVQLNRDVEKRDNKRPQLPDIRESGAFEQDAYGVFFPFRESYYDAARKHDRVQDTELIIAKHRNGSLPTLRFTFTAPCMRFDVLAEDEQDDPQANLDPSWKTKPRREAVDPEPDRRLPPEKDTDDGRFGPKR